jgi:hypothetical protein
MVGDVTGKYKTSNYRYLTRWETLRYLWNGTLPKAPLKSSQLKEIEK